MASDRHKQNLLPSSHTSSPPTLATLRTSLPSFDSGNLHIFIDHLSEAADRDDQKNGGNSRRHSISLYRDLAKVHRKAVVPFIPRIMASIIRSFSPNLDRFSSSFSSSSSPQQHQQLLVLYEAAAKVVSSIARYTIDPTSSALYNKEILHSLCSPLLSSLVNSTEEREVEKEGVVLCLQSIVESEKWKYSDLSLHRCLCDCINSTLLSVNGPKTNVSCLNGPETDGTGIGLVVNGSQSNVPGLRHVVNEPQTDDLVGLQQCAVSTSALGVNSIQSASSLGENDTESGSNLLLNSTQMASALGVAGTQISLGYSSDGTHSASGIDVNGTQLDFGLGVNGTQGVTSSLGLSMKDSQLASPLRVKNTQPTISSLAFGVNGTQFVSPLCVNNTLSGSPLGSNSHELAAILQLMKSVTKFCAEAAQPHAVEWLKLGLNHLERKKKVSSWQHRVASAQLISTILRTYNLLNLDLDLHKIKEILLSCQIHDNLPVVRAAVAEALEALPGHGNLCEMALLDASSPLKGFALHSFSPGSITSSLFHDNMDPSLSASPAPSPSSSSSSSQMKHYPTEAKDFPFHKKSSPGFDVSPSFSSAKPNLSPEWVSQQAVNSKICYSVDTFKTPLRPASSGGDNDFTIFSFDKAEESDTHKGNRSEIQCDESKSKMLSFPEERSMNIDANRRFSRQLDDVLCNGCNDLLLTPDGKINEGVTDLGDKKDANIKPRLCMDDFIFTTPRRILHSLQSGRDLIEMEGKQSDNKSVVASKGSESSLTEEAKYQGSPSSSCCTSEEMKSSEHKEQQLHRRGPKSRTRRGTTGYKCLCEETVMLARNDENVHKAKKLLRKCLSSLDCGGEPVARLSLDLKIGDLELLDKSSNSSSLGVSPTLSKMGKSKSSVTLGGVLCVTLALGFVLIALMLFQLMHQSWELHVLVPT